MTKPPKYPIPAGDVADDAMKGVRVPELGPPPGLYAYPSFKHRHEIRQQLASGDAAYYRAYPQFLPRHTRSLHTRRRMIREGR